MCVSFFRVRTMDGFGWQNMPSSHQDDNLNTSRLRNQKEFGGRFLSEMTFKKSLQAFKFYDIFEIYMATFFYNGIVKVSIFKDIKLFKVCRFLWVFSKMFWSVNFKSKQTRKRLRKFNGRVRLFWDQMLFSLKSPKIKMWRR